MAKSTTDQEYYENKANWGEGQYITLENVIDTMMATVTHDSYFKHAQRHEYSIHGKLGIKRLKADILEEHRAIMFQLAPSLIFPYPRFQTNWKRLSVVNKCGSLQVLIINQTPLIHDYLQDHLYELFFDQDGQVRRAVDVHKEVEYCCLPIDCVDNPTTTKCPDDTFNDSWAKPNKEGGYFSFSSDLEDEQIVIEFTSAGLEGLDDCDVLINHNLELTVMRWIQWSYLFGLRNVPQTKLQEHWGFFTMEKTRSKALMGPDLTLEQIVKSAGLRYQN